MADLRTATRNLLVADTDLMAILTGGVFDARQLPQNGMTVDNLPHAANGITVLPFIVIRFRNSTGKEIIRKTERRFCEFFIYEHRGYQNIEQAKRRLKTLLDGKQVRADDAGICMFHWVTDIGEVPNDQLGFIPCELSRYYVDYVRK